MAILSRQRKGMVVALVAISLAIILSFVAIAVDGGLLLDRHQRLQATADAAALAAANDLYLNWRANHGLDPAGTAQAAAEAVAMANGFPNITVNIPPLSGPFVGLPGYAEVYVNYSQKRYFSTIFGSANMPISCRAVGQGCWSSPKMGILVLDPTAPASLNVVGGATVTVTGAPLIINSNAPNAGSASGGGTVSGSEIDIGGVPGYNGGHWFGNIYSGQPPTPDPLAYIPEPDPSTMVVQATHSTHASGNQTLSLQPGVYQGGITVSGQASLNLAPGIYYMQGGGFSFTGQGSLNAPGVMIVNAPQSNSDNISINGSGAINLSPPLTGTYAGISLWQVRSSTNTISVTGNGGSSMTGTFYTAHGTLKVSGNGTNDVIGSQYISYLLSVNGNGSFTVAWNANLVGRVRIIRLVE
jgi:Flp pilus assembly protein TadG